MWKLNSILPGNPGIQEMSQKNWKLFELNENIE